MNTKIVKTDNNHPDFHILIKMLDEDLYQRYGELQKQYDRHNKVDKINDILVIYDDIIPVACGAFKQYSSDSVELKRIFVAREYRGKGLAKRLISELEALAREKGYTYAVLETGTKQHEAINLYKHEGYEVIENYGPYAGKEYSICMRKKLQL